MIHETHGIEPDGVGPDPAPHPRSGTGFTLIELLLVVAVISLISAVVIPKFTATRARANAATLRADLAGLRSSLDAFHSQFGRYTRDLDSLGYRSSAGVQTYIRLDGVEWEAVALMEGPPLRLCRVTSRDLETSCDQSAVPLPVSRLDSLVAQLPWAATALQAPSAMHVGEHQTVTLVLDPTYAPEADVDTIALPEAMRNTLRATLILDDSSRVIDFQPVRRAPRMLARLEGTGFEIDPPPSADARLTQGVLASRSTEWRWSVRAIASGDQLLQVSLYALIDLERETPVRFQVLRREIDVTVTWTDYLASFVTRHWIWLVMLALAPPPLILWLIKRLRKPRTKPTPPWQVP